jgi:hypothetical protein
MESFNNHQEILMFAAIRAAIITFFSSITHLFKAFENTAVALETASEVTIIQANSWKVEQKQELLRLKSNG